LKGAGDSLYMGFIHAGSNKVIREGKYAVSKKEYPGKSYPPYACGAGYILGHSIVEYAERKLLVEYDTSWIFSQ